MCQVRVAAEKLLRAQDPQRPRHEALAAMRDLEKAVRACRRSKHDAEHEAPSLDASSRQTSG